MNTMSMGRRVALVISVAMMLTAGVGVETAEASFQWCRNDPPIRVQKPNGTWFEGNVGVEVFADNGFGWATGDTKIFVYVPDETTGWKYKSGGVWYVAALDTWYNAGPGYGAFDELIFFSKMTYLDIVDGKIEIEVQAQIFTDGTINNAALRWYSDPVGAPVKTSNPEGKVIAPPGILADKLVA
mgnify:FL=1